MLARAMQKESSSADNNYRPKMMVGKITAKSREMINRIRTKTISCFSLMPLNICIDCAKGTGSEKYSDIPIKIVITNS